MEIVKQTSDETLAIQEQAKLEERLVVVRWRRGEDEGTAMLEPDGVAGFVMRQVLACTELDSRPFRWCIEKGPHSP